MQSHHKLFNNNQPLPLLDNTARKVLLFALQCSLPKSLTETGNCKMAASLEYGQQKNEYANEIINLVDTRRIGVFPMGT